jgi:hypothetical protein
MRHLSWTVVLLVLLGTTAQAGSPKKGHATTHSNTTRFYSQTGRPEGHATTQGKTTRFYSQTGRPQGHATTQGNTTRYYSQTGRPMGSARR